MTEKTVKDETEANHAEGSAQIRHGITDLNEKVLARFIAFIVSSSSED